MTYKQRTVLFTAYEKQQRRILKRFIIEGTITLMLIISGTALGVWLGQTNFSGLIITIRTFIFGG